MRCREFLDAVGLRRDRGRNDTNDRLRIKERCYKGTEAMAARMEWQKLPRKGADRKRLL